MEKKDTRPGKVTKSTLILYSPNKNIFRKSSSAIDLYYTMSVSVANGPNSAIFAKTIILTLFFFIKNAETQISKLKKIISTFSSDQTNLGSKHELVLCDT